MGASMQSGGEGGGSGRRRRRRPRYNEALMAEINVTPFVDVMLVLLIVFMVAAPLLSVGVPVEMPPTDAAPLPATDEEPVTITIDEAGRLYLGEARVPSLDDLPAQLEAMGVDGAADVIHIRGDLGSQYGDVYQVMGVLSDAGFVNFGLVGAPRGADQ